MSFKAKIDFSGLARTGLEVVGNRSGAGNQVLEIPGSNGAIVGGEVFAHIKNPGVDFKITASVTLSDLKLGKVHYSQAPIEGGGPWALKHVHVHTGAGEEPTFSCDLVQIEAGASRAVCVFDVDSLVLSAARHALTFGAFTFEESKALTLQSSDFDADCELDPTTINGVPRASDAVKGKETVQVTFWTDTDEEEPDVEVDDDWIQTGDWDCTGQDSSMFVWTATFTKYLEASVQSPSTQQQQTPA